jgi:hypothetical protein
LVGAIVTLATEEKLSTQDVNITIVLRKTRKPVEGIAEINGAVHSFDQPVICDLAP